MCGRCGKWKPLQLYHVFVCVHTHCCLWHLLFCVVGRFGYASKHSIQSTLSGDTKTRHVCVSIPFFITHFCSVGIVHSHMCRITLPDTELLLPANEHKSAKEICGPALTKEGLNLDSVVLYVVSDLKHMSWDY